MTAVRWLRLFGADGAGRLIALSAPTRHRAAPQAGRFVAHALLTGYTKMSVLARTADNPTGRANSGNEDRNEGSDGCSRTEEVAHIVDASIVAPCNSSEIRL